MSKTLIVIAGPTAIGKTALSIQLAQHFNTGIISADSRQCYREMNIGTAKPNREELANAQHYFIDTHSISEEVNAGSYEKLALGYAKEIFSGNDIAIAVGGTGLYIKALCEGIDEMPDVNPEIERSINEQFKEKGLAWLQQKLHDEDPLFFEHAEKNNPHRLLRALVFKLSMGKSITLFKTGIKKERPFNILKIGLELPRTTLYERINLRVMQMMKEGLLEEVKSLLPFKDLKSLQTVGYTELFDFLQGNTTLEKAVGLIQQHTRNYAKRQMTWFKKDRDIHWFLPNDYSGILAYLEKHIGN